MSENVHVVLQSRPGMIKLYSTLQSYHYPSISHGPDMSAMNPSPWTV